MKQLVLLGVFLFMFLPVLYPSIDEEVFNLIGRDSTSGNLDIRSTSRVSDKPTGATEGGVFIDSDDIVWFVKKGQYPQYEYLGSQIMRILLGPKIPVVRLVDGKTGFTASKQLLGFIHKDEAPEHLERYGDGQLRVALDWLGILDRHPGNMGYLPSDRGLEATRVDYDHSFTFVSKPELIMDPEPYNEHYDYAYAESLMLRHSFDEVIAMFRQISELSDDVIIDIFSSGEKDLAESGYEYSEEDLIAILDTILYRKEAIAKLLNQIEDDDYLKRLSLLNSGNEDESLSISIEEEGYRHELLIDMLYESAESGNLPLLKRVISAGIDPSVDESYVLIHAIKGGQIDVLDYLIEQGIDVTGAEFKALYTASYYGNAAIVSRLLQARKEMLEEASSEASWTSTALSYINQLVWNDDDALELALEIAKEKGHKDVADLLEKALKE